jgi:hypothetical protein
VISSGDPREWDALQETLVSLPLTLTSRPLYPPNIIHTRQTRTETSMNAKDLARHDGSDRERVEHVDKGLPRLDISPSFTFVVESVHYEGLKAEIRAGSKRGAVRQRPTPQRECF